MSAKFYLIMASSIVFYTQRESIWKYITTKMLTFQSGHKLNLKEEIGARVKVLKCPKTRAPKVPQS